MNRFSRDFALIRTDGKVLAESHDVNRLEEFRSELVDDGVVSIVVMSDLPRSRAA